MVIQAILNDFTRLEVLLLMTFTFFKRRLSLVFLLLTILAGPLHKHNFKIINNLHLPSNICLSVHELKCPSVCECLGAFESPFILRMTVSGRGLIFQLVLLVYTYNNDTITLQKKNQQYRFPSKLHVCVSLCYLYICVQVSLYESTTHSLSTFPPPPFPSFTAPVSENHHVWDCVCEMHAQYAKRPKQPCSCSEYSCMHACICLCLPVCSFLSPTIHAKNPVTLAAMLNTLWLCDWLYVCVCVSVCAYVCVCVCVCARTRISVFACTTLSPFLSTYNKSKSLPCHCYCPQQPEGCVCVSVCARVCTHMCFSLSYSLHHKGAGWCVCVCARARISVLAHTTLSPFLSAYNKSKSLPCHPVTVHGNLKVVCV